VNEVILRYKQPRDELALKLDEYKLLNASLNYSEVGDFLKLALQGGIATKVIQNQREMDVRVRFAEKYRNSERALQEIRIKNKNKLFVPLSDISTGKESKVPMKIFHKNKRRTLSYTIRTTDLSKSEIQNLMKEILSKELPENYRVEIDEFNKNQDNKSLYFLSSFLFLSYFIISAYYESFKKSIYTFSFILIILCFQIVIQYLLYTTFTQIFYNSIQISICTSIYLLLDDKKTNKLNFIFSFTLLFILFLLFLFFSIEIINLVFFILFNQFICLFLIYYIHPLTNHLFGSLFTIKE
jgi:multidrug efflux pump subunit AcrB